MAEPKKRPFSSMRATLAWARKTFGEENVALCSWWLAAQGVDREGRPRAGGVRKDLWGYQDLQVLDGLPGVLAIQACGTDVGAHQRKMGSPELAGRVTAWLHAGNRLLLVAWREVWSQTSARVKQKKRMPRFLEASAASLIDLNDIPFPGRLPIQWTEHETWPASVEIGGDAARGPKDNSKNSTSHPTSNPAPEAIPTSGADLQPPLFGETKNGE